MTWPREAAIGHQDGFPAGDGFTVRHFNALDSAPEAPHVGPAIRAEVTEIGIVGSDVSRWIGKVTAEVVFAVEGMIPSGAVTIAGGDGGAGKGVLLQTASSCVSLGLPCFGRATRQGRAVYADAEDPNPFYMSVSTTSPQSLAST